ncbi:MAG: DUF6125 family protein [Candidatus Hodarchaeota archaeon]
MVLDKDGIINYLRRSYTWVDGFWFIEVERYLDSFDNALKIDIQVWIKITQQQAKLAQKLLYLSKSDVYAIIETLKVKWLVDGHSYELGRVDKNLGSVVIRKCPWFETMKRSGREHLAGHVCRAVCPPLYQTWAETINPKVKVEMSKFLGKGAEGCEINFVLSSS